jgi:acyl-CoA synthetase (AMP-forming)/AMP-acid ligase II
LAVQAAVVTTCLTEEGKRIFAAVQSSAGASTDQESIVSHLARVLPYHMIPTQIYVFNQFPTLPSGKFDQQAVVREILKLAKSQISAQSMSTENTR